MNTEEGIKSDRSTNIDPNFAGYLLQHQLEDAYGPSKGNPQLSSFGHILYGSQ